MCLKRTKSPSKDGKQKPKPTEKDLEEKRKLPSETDRLKEVGQELGSSSESRDKNTYMAPNNHDAQKSERLDNCNIEVSEHSEAGIKGSFEEDLKEEMSQIPKEDFEGKKSNNPKKDFERKLSENYEEEMEETLEIFEDKADMSGNFKQDGAVPDNLGQDLGEYIDAWQENSTIKTTENETGELERSEKETENNSPRKTQGGLGVPSLPPGRRHKTPLLATPIGVPRRSELHYNGPGWHASDKVYRNGGNAKCSLLPSPERVPRRPEGYYNKSHLLTDGQLTNGRLRSTCLPTACQPVQYSYDYFREYGSHRHIFADETRDLTQPFGFSDTTSSSETSPIHSPQDVESMAFSADDRETAIIPSTHVETAACSTNEEYEVPYEDNAHPLLLNDKYNLYVSVANDTENELHTFYPGGQRVEQLMHEEATSFTHCGGETLPGYVDPTSFGHDIHIPFDYTERRLEPNPFGCIGEPYFGYPFISSPPLENEIPAALRIVGMYATINNSMNKNHLFPSNEPCEFIALYPFESDFQIWYPKPATYIHRIDEWLNCSAERNIRDSTHAIILKSA
ncbi:hypothetical protein PoB_002994000 [Plakobranchus ocellatus]|uniref:Uncharacterized protein n=1 Tax=Plakobranchus ocellatus TaxID=259542 RepID=A0AAV4A9G6_9GAST|nr:hypothetical protein PoB_002994000 [Plakobranchus ocellatus]